MKHVKNVICEQCEKQISVCLYQTNRRFCSRTCYLNHMRQHPQSTKKKGRMTRLCEWCHKPFEVAHFSTLTKYCSPSCREKGRQRTHRKMTGDASSQWRGGRWTANGYVFLAISGLSPKDQKLANKMRYSYLNYTVVEHRLVMARHLGRALKRGEIVHHRNGIKHDNRLENLELTTYSQHANTIVFGNHRLQCPKCRFAAEANAFDVIRRRPRPMRPDPKVDMPLFEKNLLS